jgi:glycerophosphoryl diester phosphodiesterase
LEEYFSICKKYGKQSILELKNEMPAEKIWEIVEIAKKMKWFEGVTFISFSWENLVRLREKYPTANAQFLTDKCTDKEIERMIEHEIDADLCGYCITPEKVEKLHKAGRIVNVWTVDRLSDAELLKTIDVDMITSNILE